MYGNPYRSFLVERTHYQVSAVTEEQKVALKPKTTEATDMIKVLNSKSREELEEIKMFDRTSTILGIKKVLQKRI